MTTPDFFNDVAPIVVRDPLCEVLGAASNGLLEYTYTDVVKLAGHSCPTVAGAFLMIQEGLKSLYEDAIPVRGEIKVLMKGRLGEGVVGVIANVASMITGATDVSGFHGIAGKFDRRGLLFYDAQIEGEMALVRTDTGMHVELNYNPSFVSGDPHMSELLPLIASGQADSSQRTLFGQLWQDRVKRILIDNKADSRLIHSVVH